MVNRLIKLADHLDKKGLHKEADYLDAIIKLANENPFWNETGKARAEEIHGMGGYSVEKLKQNADLAWKNLQKGIVPMGPKAYDKVLPFTNFSLQIRYDILNQDIKKKYKELHGVNLDTAKGKRFAYNKYLEVMSRMGKMDDKSTKTDKVIQQSYDYPIDIGWAKVTNIDKADGKVISVSVSLTEKTLKSYPGKKDRVYTAQSGQNALKATVDALNNLHKLNLSI